MHKPARVALTLGSVAALVAGLVTPVDAAVAHYRPGAPGVGDPYFPHEGNGGYNVGLYNLHLRYRLHSHELSGAVTVHAKATQNLSRFDLDLLGMHVDKVKVDGVRAQFDRRGRELRITPASGLRKGTHFRVKVVYHGVPKTIVGSPIVFGSPYGWQYTKDGTFVGDEPNAASTWFPCNDHPSDKAKFIIRMQVPSNRQVVANGYLKYRHKDRARHTTTWAWYNMNPTATYLATVDIGKWRFQRGKTPSGIPETVAYDPVLAKAVKRRQVFKLTGEITDYWAKKFGPYAFDSTGAIVDHVPSVGFSLETETRPLYGFAPDQVTMAHELAHQWFGDSVSVATWRNIWLNEGFATFAQELWLEHVYHVSTYRQARSDYQSHGKRSGFWNQSIADPKRNTMFSTAVYDRGAMTLASLRHKIGDHAFFRLLHRWTAKYHFGNANTADFERLAAKVTGHRLTHFFHVWLVAKKKPASLNP